MKGEVYFQEQGSNMVFDEGLEASKGKAVDLPLPASSYRRPPEAGYSWGTTLRSSNLPKPFFFLRHRLSMGKRTLLQAGSPPLSVFMTRALNLPHLWSSL
ncbi:hypothetical protein HPB49_008916 [Dermacentor silvarum]|uniref:Uncharacterized protein n=1 Tax=Dermacentor silvarum TaxID=543639 RepID=A0ACB8C8F5_DERSI|nr:hypothetical protein HPB49_008916 [Dermacentor silvarum]